MKPVVIHRTGAVPENALRPGIVAVYRGGAALAEQGRLGGGVVLHGAVKVQVVPAEIGESGYSIRQAVDPVKCQCVGGDLHHGVGAAGIGHLPQQALHLPGLRGGAAGGEDRVPDAAAVGAHETGPYAQGLEHACRQPGHGGFAVGAGDADQGQLPVRVAEEISRHKGQGPAGVRNKDIGQPLHRVGGHGACRAPLPGLGRVIVAVGVGSVDGHEHLAGPYRV